MILVWFRFRSSLDGVAAKMKRTLLNHHTSTTLADLLLRLFTASSSAVWASLRWRSKYEIDDGVAHRWQAWLRRRSVDSFFSAPLVRGEGVARRRRRSWSSARDDEDLAMIAPRSDQARVPLSTADAPVRKSIVP